jgi:hypothetical protein
LSDAVLSGRVEWCDDVDHVAEEKLKKGLMVVDRILPSGCAS